MSTYDSKLDTLKHIGKVAGWIGIVVAKLESRALAHDASKLREPEKSTFDEFTPRLAGLTYGSDEYRACLDAMRPALLHHYAENRHHPEHFIEGVGGMTLLDILEMLCDWKAASERHADGDIAESLRINRERFGIGDQLARVLENTARELGWID